MSKLINISGLKTLLEPLVHMINKKAERPDWNENDPSSINYIAGRTHYEGVEERTISSNFTVANGEPVFNPFAINIVDGESYAIEWDGVMYNCVAYIAQGPDAPSIGNGELVGVPGGNGEPFFISIIDGDVLVFGEDGDHTFRSSVSVKTIHKIDKKYLPDMIGMSGSFTGAEVFNDYKNNEANGIYSHAEGSFSIANGYVSHAEGDSTMSIGGASHAEGSHTGAEGLSSHAEGDSTVSIGSASHAEGSCTKSQGEYSHAEGSSTQSTGFASHAEGENTTASGSPAHAEGENTTASEWCSHAEGYYTTASGACAHAEGHSTKASGSYTHAEGMFTTASGMSAHAEGNRTTASGECAHAEGYYTTASGEHAHAEGRNTTSSGKCGHAEGYATKASGDYSHSGGINARAEGNYSFVFGDNITTKRSLEFTIGSYNYSNENSGLYINKTIQSLSFGNNSYSRNTSKVEPTIDSENKKLVFVDITSKFQQDLEVGDYIIYDKYYYRILTIERPGSYQVEKGELIEGKDTKGTNVFTVGNGNSTKHSNAHTLDWSGNAWYAGDVYVGSTSGTNKDDGSKKLATEEYVTTLVGETPVSEQITSALEGYVKLDPNDTAIEGEAALVNAGTFNGMTYDAVKTDINSSVTELQSVTNPTGDDYLNYAASGSMFVLSGKRNGSESAYAEFKGDGTGTINGAAIYTVNNPPSYADVGAASASHTHNIITDSSNGAVAHITVNSGVPTMFLSVNGVTNFGFARENDSMIKYHKYNNGTYTHTAISWDTDNLSFSLSGTTLYITKS